MKSYTRTASLIITIALLAAALTQSSVSAAPRTPEQIMQQAKQVAIGSRHACALMEDGSVWCWGNNESNLMGNYYVCPYSHDPLNYMPTRCPPAPVPGLPGKAKSIHTIVGFVACAVMRSDKSTWCWGHLDPEVDPWNASPPVQIPGLYDVKEIISSYALTHSGELWRVHSDCGDSDASVSHPALVMKDVRSLVSTTVDPGSGYYHQTTCALIKDGSVKCWGHNYWGHLGNDAMDYSCTPVDVFNPFPYKTYVPAVNP